jgi:uncharacterized membrane protein YhaH (DUF805 family)
MNFMDAVKTCFTKYADFNGRAARPEYWWFVLFILIAVVLLSIISRLIAFVFELAVILPHIAVGVRRMHDIGRSGWWLLIGFVPLVGWIILLVFLCQPSKSSAS